MSNLYIPSDAINLKDLKQPQIILGLQGAPGTGKTTSALTFPNPIVAALEPGLQNFCGEDIPVVPFHNVDWVESLNKGKYKRTNPNHKFPQIEACFLDWMKEHAVKLMPEQTLIIDSWSAFQFFEDYNTSVLPLITKKGSEDGFASWARKQEIAAQALSLVHTCKCNVVVTFHETQKRDEKGKLLEKIAPLMQGGFVVQLKRFFPNFFRTVVRTEKDQTGKVIKAEYCWQVNSNDKFDAKCTLDVPVTELYVEQNFSVFTKYKRKSKQ